MFRGKCMFCSWGWGIPVSSPSTVSRFATTTFSHTQSYSGVSHEDNLHERNVLEAGRVPLELGCWFRKSSCMDTAVEPRCQAPHPLLLTFLHITTAPHIGLETSTKGQPRAGPFSQLQNTREQWPKQTKRRSQNLCVTKAPGAVLISPQ